MARCLRGHAVEQRSKNIWPQNCYLVWHCVYSRSGTFVRCRARYNGNCNGYQFRGAQKCQLTPECRRLPQTRPRNHKPHGLTIRPYRKLPVHNRCKLDMIRLQQQARSHFRNPRGAITSEEFEMSNTQQGSPAPPPAQIQVRNRRRPAQRRQPLRKALAPRPAFKLRRVPK